jgi:hypothetical protein
VKKKIALMELTIKGKRGTAPAHADAHLLRRNLTGARCKQMHIRRAVQCGATVSDDLSRTYFVAALHSVAFASRDTNGARSGITLGSSIMRIRKWTSYDNGLTVIA